MEEDRVNLAISVEAKYEPIIERIVARLQDGQPVCYNATVDFTYNATVDFTDPCPVGMDQQIDAWIDLIACAVAWIADHQ